jgi:2-keto-4-pentenoate hydratase/2-oxohepta-3-ene-1,7-dioic acid hydratase in catechol pathway
MKLATASRPDGSTALHVAVGDGYVDVPAAAGRAGEATLLELADVGAFLRAGPDARAALDRLVAAPAGAVVPGVALEALRLAPPVLDPGAIVCIGRNYAAHAAERREDVPAFPLLFSKFRNALLGHGGTIRYPSITRELDYEGELAVVIGRTATAVPAASAHEHVGGYTIINDVSARDRQSGDPQWIRGKSLDGFAPLGPVVVTADELPDVDALRVRTLVNGEVRQDESCARMVFKVPELIEFITEGITLRPGDLIATGTPAGVGQGFDPPRFLVPGDTVEVTVSGIGTLRVSIG